MEYQDLIGIPFKDGGRDLDGLDCWGLAKIMLERQGYDDVPNYAISAYDIPSISNTIQSESHDAWRRINKPESGCVVLLANGCTPKANHVGIVIDDDRFIHSYCRTGVCISRLSRWRSHILGYYLPPERSMKRGTDYCH